MRWLPGFCRRRPKRLLAVALLLPLLGWGGWLLGREAWARYHWQLAQTAADRRDFPAALAHLACCRSVWPNRAEVYLQCARNARRAGLLDEADDALHTCRQLSGSTAPVVLERLLLTAQGGDFVSVEEALRGLFRPDRPEGLLIAEVMSWSLHARQPPPRGARAAGLLAATPARRGRGAGARAAGWPSTCSTLMPPSAITAVYWSWRRNAIRCACVSPRF